MRTLCVYYLEGVAVCVWVGKCVGVSRSVCEWVCVQVCVGVGAFHRGNMDDVTKTKNGVMQMMPLILGHINWHYNTHSNTYPHTPTHMQTGRMTHTAGQQAHSLNSDWQSNSQKPTQIQSWYNPSAGWLTVHVCLSNVSNPIRNPKNNIKTNNK